MPSVIPANVVIVTFVASVESTAILSTATTALVAVFVTTKSVFLSSFVFPRTTASIVFAVFWVTDSRIAFFTVTFVSPVRVFVPHTNVVVIVASPALTPVTSPVVSSTVAISVLSDEYVTVAVVGHDCVAFTSTLDPTGTIAASAAVRLGSLTLTLQVYFFV